MFKENFTRLCSQRHEAPSAVCMKLGLSNAAYTQWKEDSVPRRATLMRIADYFSVTVESLLEDKKEEAPPAEPEEPISEVKRRLHALVDTADEDEVERMLVMMEALIEAERKKREARQ